MVEPPRGRTTLRRRLASPATSRGAAWWSRGEGGVLVGRRGHESCEGRER